MDIAAGQIWERRQPGCEDRYFSEVLYVTDRSVVFVGEDREPIVFDRITFRTHHPKRIEHGSEYLVTKDAAVAEVVKAYTEGAADVRGGMCNVLLNIGLNGEEWLKDDLLRLADALGKLSKIYEGAR
jgi:hypothetical protein